MFEEIINNDTWCIVEKINKGWSDDTKYYIETDDNQKLLLRVANIDKWAEQFGQEDMDTMIEICKRSFGHYENFTRIIPNWYKKS